MAGGLYLLLNLALYFYQERLLFYPPTPVRDIYQQLQEHEIQYKSQGKTRYGWKKSIRPEASKTLLYFGGNAEDVVYFVSEAEALNIRQIIAVNHPGYGKSEGRPSEKNLYQNALDAWDHGIESWQLKPEEVIVAGRSLGSSVATWLAANRKTGGLILITPFDSISEIAARQYRYFPVNILLKHRFHTVDYIDDVDAPVLMIAAARDEIIDDSHLQNLYRHCGENCRLVRYQQVGHNSIHTHPDYYQEINRFIDSL